MTNCQPTPGSDEDPAIVAPVSEIPGSDVVTGEKLVGKMDNLSTLLRELGEVQSSQKRSWRWIKGGSGLILFDVIVSILGGIGIFIIYGVVGQVQQQTHETCSLYGYVINSYSPKAPNRSILGADKYDGFYRQLEGSADRLHCDIPHKI